MRSHKTEKLPATIFLRFEISVIRRAWWWFLQTENTQHNDTWHLIINNQRDAALSSPIYYPLRDYSTCFGCSLHPSSGVHKTVDAITGTSHVSVWCRYKSVKRCGNKMPTKCNRGFYCRSYCLLNIFRASLCPSSGAQEYYTVVAACGILCCGFFK